MSVPEFALVEDGTQRVLLFFVSAPPRLRLLDGTWADRWPNVDEVVMPEELREFRIASDMELRALAAEAAAARPAIG